MWIYFLASQALLPVIYLMKKQAIFFGLDLLSLEAQLRTFCITKETNADGNKLCLWLFCFHRAMERKRWRKKIYILVQAGVASAPLQVRHLPNCGRTNIFEQRSHKVACLCLPWARPHVKVRTLLLERVSEPVQRF